MTTTNTAQADEPRLGGAGSERGLPFATTHWSVVLAAGGQDTTRARKALSKLCQTYWPPLYAYVRRRGYSVQDAQDLTQGFFAHLLQHESIARASPAKGRFRSFLLVSLSHYLANEWAKNQTLKRGCGQVVSLNVDTGESLLERLPADTLTPESAFEKQWAITLLEKVHERLEQEHRAARKVGWFETLRFALSGSRSAVPYADLAKRLNTTEGAVKVAVHRLRQRYRALLREVIAETVTTPDEVEDELRFLVRVLSSG